MKICVLAIQNHNKAQLDALIGLMGVTEYNFCEWVNRVKWETQDLLRKIETIRRSEKFTGYSARIRRGMGDKKEEMGALYDACCLILGTMEYTPEVKTDCRPVSKRDINSIFNEITG